MLSLLRFHHAPRNVQWTATCDAVMQISEPVDASGSSDSPSKRGFLVDTAPGGLKPKQAGDDDSAENLHFRAK